MNTRGRVDVVWVCLWFPLDFSFAFPFWDLDEWADFSLGPHQTAFFFEAVFPGFPGEEGVGLGLVAFSVPR